MRWKGGLRSLWASRRGSGDVARVHKRVEGLIDSVSYFVVMWYACGLKRGGGSAAMLSYREDGSH